MNRMQRTGLCNKCGTQLPLVESFMFLIPGDCAHCGPVEVKEERNSFLTEYKSTFLPNKESLILSMQFEFCGKDGKDIVLDAVDQLLNNGLMPDNIKQEYYNITSWDSDSANKLWSRFLRDYLDKLAPTGYKFSYNNTHWIYQKK